MPRLIGLLMIAAFVAILPFLGLLLLKIIVALMVVTGLAHLVAYWLGVDDWGGTGGRH